MYTVIASSIGSLKSIRKGRANTRLACWEKPSFWRSYGAKYLSSPVSLRIFWARRTMMIGLDNVARQIGQSMVNGKMAHRKVSGSVRTIKIKHAPAKKVRTQNTHRQSTPAVAMKPETMGPSVGPAKGARVKKASASPRVPASQISDIKALWHSELVG